MKNILVLDLGDGETTQSITFLDEQISIQKIGCHGDLGKVQAILSECDGQVDAIGLEDMPAMLELGPERQQHIQGARLKQAARITPVVDGSGVRAGLERWGVILADRAEPGIFSEKRILMVPGLNHEGLVQALGRHSHDIRYADPVVYLALPEFLPLVNGRRPLEQMASLILEQLKDAPYRRIIPQAGSPGVRRASRPFEWADVIAGDISAIRRYAPGELKHKTVVTTSASEEDIEDLRQRGVSIAVVLIPIFHSSGMRFGFGTAAVEAILAAMRKDPDAPLTEDTYLDMIAEFSWTPDIRYLQPDEVGINRFAFVIHPLDVGFIHKHRWFWWTRYLPDALVEATAAYFPPLYISRITGGKSPVTGQRIEGYLYALGATPRQMLSHGERFTYQRLVEAARRAQRRGARIMGLGAFTSVVGDAGITVANEADLAITSGNSLTVAATLEAAKQAVIQMGASDLTRGKAMVIGATGSIGSVCARLLAQAIYDVVLVSIEPEKLIDLKCRIKEETPGAQVTIATKSAELIGECDLIVTATSAFGQRVLDITRCKPGAVICDVARPPDINPAEAALRPDVLVIESGEVLIPGEIDFGYDIGLPPKTAYACLAETALLAMEGRFEDYTLGRDISMERVKEIYHLFKKHQFRLAGLRSFGEYISEEGIAMRRQAADRLRNDAELFAREQAAAAEKLRSIPAQSKGVAAKGRFDARWLWLVAGAGLVAYLFKPVKKQVARA